MAMRFKESGSNCVNRKLQVVAIFDILIVCQLSRVVVLDCFKVEQLDAILSRSNRKDIMKRAILPPVVTGN